MCAGDGDKHPLKQSIGELEYQGEIETLQALRHEAHRTLDHQLAALDDMDSKAMAIMRVNIVLLGLILTLLSLAADDRIVEAELQYVTGLTNSYMFIGVLALLSSTSLGALTYTASDSDIGIESEKIHAVIDAGLTEREFEIAATQSYGYWIRHNRRTNKLNAPLVTLTSVLVIIALAHLSLAVYVAFIDRGTYLLAALTWMLLFVLVIIAGLPFQAYEAINVWQEEHPR